MQLIIWPLWGRGHKKSKWRNVTRVWRMPTAESKEGCLSLQQKWASRGTSGDCLGTSGDFRHQSWSLLAAAVSLLPSRPSPSSSLSSTHCYSPRLLPASPISFLPFSLFLGHKQVIVGPPPFSQERGHLYLMSTIFTPPPLISTWLILCSLKVVLVYDLAYFRSSHFGKWIQQSPVINCRFCFWKIVRIRG